MQDAAVHKRNDRTHYFTERDLATFSFKTLFLSDLHLGSGNTAIRYLYEFLKHLDFDTLKDVYLNGDLMDGWHQKHLTEMEKRVLDIFNYMAERGIRLHYIPGNHDEKLAPLQASLNQRRHLKTFPENFIFETDSVHWTDGPNPLKIKNVHGHQYDPPWFEKPWGMPIVQSISSGYDTLVKFDHKLAKAMLKFHLHVSFAKQIKSAVKALTKRIFSSQAIIKDLFGGDADILAMGHTHSPEVGQITKNGVTRYIVNSGDWVESSTAAYIDDTSPIPQLLHYKIEREKRGFGDLPDINDPHPSYFAVHRPMTERQVRHVERLWPSPERELYVEKFNHASGKLAEHRQEQADLRRIMEALGRERFDTAARERLEQIVLKTKKESYAGQRENLRRIFKKSADGSDLERSDILLAKTIVREFITRSDRKIHKHAETRADMAAKLGYKNLEV